MLTQQAGHLEFGSFEFEFDAAVDAIRPICGRSLKRRRNITTTIMAMKGITSRPRSPS